MFSSCEKSEDITATANDPKYYTTANNLSILKEDALDYIENAVTNDSLIVFSSETPDEVIPKVGSHIYVPVSEKTPYGMLVKVVSVSKGNITSVHTEALSLDEVFEYLSIDETVSSSTKIEGVFDDEGNPIDFEVVDTTEMNRVDSTFVPISQTRATTRTSFQFDFDWKKECLKFPIKLYEGKSGKDKIKINGMVYVGFDKFDFDIDINKNKVSYINLDATPYIKIAAESLVSTESELELSERIGQLHMSKTFIIPTPVPIPIVVHATLYIYGTCGIKGELSAKLGLQYKYNCNCVATYKNDQWTSDVKHGGFDNKSPWTVGEFDVKGEIYSGAKLGLLVSLYSATSGIGFNILPKYSIGVEAKLSSEDLLKVNPQVYLDLKAGSEVYAAARLFGKDLAKYTFTFPDYTLWSSSVYLLPNIENYTATGASSSADISWTHNGLHFLNGKTGTTIFESDKTTALKSYTPSPTSENKMGYCTYNVNATGLTPGSTYYVAPFVSWKNFKWYGNKEKITTEAGYTFYWKCASRDDNDYLYKLDFTFDPGRSSSLQRVFSQASYDGTGATRTFQCEYNASTNILTGTVASSYVNGDYRVDGFTLTLSDDTGYVINERVVSNGACEGAIRLVKNQSGQSRAKSLSKKNNYVIEDYECSEGDNIVRR